MSAEGNTNTDIDKEQFSLLIKGLATLVVMFLIIQKNYFVYYKPKAIILIVVVSCFFFFSIQEIKLTFVITVIFLISFLELIDRYFWKYRPFLWMFTTKDFSGTYKGEQVSKYNKDVGKTLCGKRNAFEEYEDKSKVELIIHQNGSSLNLISFYYDSRGMKKMKLESDKVILSKTEDNQHYILTCHHGDIGVLKNSGYHGTTILKLIEKENTICMEGGYYTNRNSQTRGEFVKLKRVNKQTNHPF
jgi:hypothetical protein